MSKSFKAGMSRATELTKSGKLKEATALIQSLLRADFNLTTVDAAPSQTEAKIAATAEIDTEIKIAAKTESSIETKIAAKSLVAKTTAPSSAAKPRKKPAGARTGLAETLRRITSGGMPGPAPLPGTPVIVSQDARFLSLTHEAPQGSRSYRLYVPAHQSQAPMPVIVMLHGCTQTPEDFAIGTGMNDLAEEFGCLIAYPAQPSGANVQKCWNWFRPEDQGRDHGEPALIAGLTRDILDHYNGDPDRVYVAGLSAGGAAAAIVAAAYPDLFCGAGVHSGLAVGAAQDVISAFGAMRSGTSGDPQTRTVPTIAFHGLSDTTVHPSNADAVIAQTLTTRPGLSSTMREGTSAGGRSFQTSSYHAPDGRSMAEHWEISGAGHAWAGGQPGGSYTDPEGPDASREMVRFFLQHAR
ncbi:MAG: PHB depolymerase family esterase [Cypionkella sp.]